MLNKNRSGPKGILCVRPFSATPPGGCFADRVKTKRHFATGEDRRWISASGLQRRSGRTHGSLPASSARESGTSRRRLQRFHWCQAGFHHQHQLFVQALVRLSGGNAPDASAPRPIGAKVTQNNAIMIAPVGFISHSDCLLLASGIHVAPPAPRTCPAMSLPAVEEMCKDAYER